MVYDFFEELKDIIKDFLLKVFKKIKYFLLIFVIILLINGIFLFDIQNPPKENIETQQLYFKEITLENWVQWITLIIIPITAGWAIYQFKKGENIKKQEKASEIAKEFSNTIVNNLDLIDSIISDSPLLNYMPLHESQVKHFKYFNVDEVRKILNNDDIVTIYKNKRFLLSKQIDNLYHLYIYKNNSECSLAEFESIKKEILQEKLSDIHKENIKKSIINSNMPYHFSELKSQTLNNLEAICMDISNEAADSNYIYQSIHQIFLRTIRILYMDISCVNKNSSDKFYTNIIYVYNMWKNKYLKDLKIEERKLKKFNNKNNPKIKTV